MNVSHYSGGGGGDNEDAADDNGAEGKRMLISKLSRRHMIPRYTTLAVKKSSLNNWRISKREENYNCNSRTCHLLLTESYIIRLYKQAIKKYLKIKNK